MGDEQGSRILCDIPVFLIQFAFRNRVQRGGRLIQNQNRRAAVHGARHQELLRFTAGKVGRVLVDLPVQKCHHAVRQAVNF